MDITIDTTWHVAADPVSNNQLGGDPSCWLHLVCDACGAIVSGSDGHRPDCRAEGDECERPTAADTELR